jgi:CPA2 family monovalent cation:H+ antiporter-2
LDHAPWLKDVLVFLAGAGLIVPLFHRARIGAVLGFLVIGVAVGPYGFVLFADSLPWLRYLAIEDRARVEPFAELGIIFLLFLIGIEMSVGRLWSLRRFVFGLGGLQFLLAAVALGLLLRFMGATASGAVVLGLCLAMSSTAVVMQLLEEQGRSATPIGRVALSVLLFQDLMVAPVLSGVQLLGRGGANIALDLASALIQAVVAVAVIILVGRFVFRPLFRFTAYTGSRELIMAITLLMVMGLALTTGYVGFSTALGAFLAGLLLSETEYRHQVEIDLAPFKGLLIGVFFISVGMTIDVRVIWEQIGFVLLAVAALFAIKMLILLIAGRLLGISWAVAIEVAILLAQAGEFAFVVITLGRSTGIVPADMAQFATVVVGLSMMATPLFAFGGHWLGQRLERLEHAAHLPPADNTEHADHVVIGGFGRVGQLLARLLEAENVPYVALDNHGALVAEQRKAGRKVYFGDASRLEFLQRAGAARARAFVVTVNTPRAAERMVAAAREKRPDAPVYARAVDAEHAARLLKLGAVNVIPEAAEASLQLGARLLEGLGLPDEAVERRIEDMREQELGRLTQLRAEAES